MRKILIFVCLWFLGAAAVAQSAQPRVEAPGEQPQKVPPIISFTVDFPDDIPPFYNIAIESTGRAEYKSTPEPKNIGDPYILKFVASEPTRTRLFELARQLNFFRGNFDYTKNKIAFTGTKTLTFKNADEEHETTYNWSENPLIQEITEIFQGAEETIELGRQLQDKYRYDKLGVDAVLKSLEENEKDHRLAEMQVLQPILTRIANDPAMMNISRRRAELLLSKMPKAEVTTASGGQQ